MTVRTGCPYCGVGCGLVAEVRGGRLHAVRGDEDHPVNRGLTCRKPLALPAASRAADRAVRPLVRDALDERFVDASWDDALDVVASRLLAIRAEHGPGSIAFYISGQLLTEDYYAVNKLAKGWLGTNNVDSNSRLCMSSAVAAYDAVLGADGPPPAYADLEQTSCILLLGSNASACHPILWGRIVAAQERGATLIVVDPRRTDAAAAADLHLQIAPGTDLALLNALLAGHELAGEWTAESAAAACGVAAEDIAAAAAVFAAGPSMALWSMGANQSIEGVAINRALLNLCVVTQNIGRPGAGPLSLTGQPNAMGGRETGGLAHLLPGYRKVVREDHRAEVEAAWGLPAGSISEKPGLPATDLFEALEDGRVKAVWICATNPAVSMPDAARAREALGRAELVVVQDAYHPTETSSLAHVVLPAAQWPEKAGTMVNSERRITLMRAAIAPPGKARADWEIFAAAARRMGFSGFDWASAAEVYDEFAALTAGRPCDQSGVSHDRLDIEGTIQWPCRSADDPGTARLYTDGRYWTASGRPALSPASPVGVADPPDADHPLVLTTGRIASQWHTMTRTAKSPELVAAEPEPFIELHPDDARRAWVGEGEIVRVVSRRGSVKLRARFVDSLRPGVAFAPFHWGALHAPTGAGGVNDLTHRETDPVSRQPGLKAIAIRVEPVVARRHGVARGAAPGSAASPRTAARPRRVLIVGGGPAGVATAETLLEHGDFAITIASDESGLPYDRVGLTDHLAGVREAADLPLHDKRWYRERGITLCGAILDARDGVARTARGEVPYDALVLATGSKPFIPPIEGIERAIAFRTRHDVRTIRGRTHGARRAVVIGGGLLGLEAARAVANRGIAVTVVHLAGQLMERQLDATAGRMLERALATQGIDVACDAMTTAIHDDRVELSTGATIAADLVIVAAGVQPETTLARTMGVQIDRGILVDDSLRTNVPGVWAVGECAEHRGVLVGLVAPALAMARAAAADIAGTPAAYLPARAATRLKVAGIDLFCSGELDGDDEVIALDTRAGHYRREVYRAGELVGTIVLGDAPAFATEGDADPLVCVCNGVRRSQIQACRDFDDVKRTTRAATGCGGCAPQVKALLAEAAEVGFQAVQAEPTETIEVLVRRPVEVRRAGRQ
ncbi:molybdopterin-dependent oxidoreductase [Solirubrobacter soli]|uniref:molybdopterin-dependent oxidoreductase n=1 Tax=Solirubrobacter soli TaxID=363832 RepID=UPI000422AE72|nr:molybdopterin-dependent oxidoreductase [Solirubrobacter soli]